MSVEATITVLVADDGRDNREFIVNYILKPNGYTPLLARDGEEAMNLVRQHHPDLILLDLQMPRMNGMEVLDALRKEGWEIPVILMTFHGSEEIAIEVYRKGVRDYVKKPYTVEEMLAAMDRCLGEVRLRKDKEALTQRLLKANKALNRRLNELNTLYQIGKNVTALVSMDQLLLRVAEAATRVIDAEQSNIYLLENNTIICRATKAHNAVSPNTVNQPSNNRIIQQAAQSGKPLVLSPEELRKHRVQNPGLPSAIACIPLLVGKRVVGVLSVENVSNDAPRFTQQDAAMLSALGDYVAIAIENARIVAELESATAAPRAAAPATGQRRTISVLSADLGSFEHVSAEADPDAVLQRLNQALTQANAIVAAHAGTLNSLHDHHVTAIFEQPDHTQQAVQAALALREALSPDAPPGIAVHLGEAIIGPVGSAATLQNHAVGPTLAVARQLQAHTQPGQILISGPVCTHLGDDAAAEEAGVLTLAGQADTLVVFELKGLS